jgi:3-mercaptopyruvate sulfurtransferase SseA
MRLILSFMFFALFGFAQQDCHKEKITTTSKTETAKANTNSGAASQTTASASTPFPAEAPRISLTDAKKAFDAGDAIFVDTRAAEGFKIEHIKGALNIPAGEFETRYTELPKNKQIIAYCS